MQENYEEAARYTKELVQTELTISYRYPTIALLFTVILLIAGYTVRLVAFLSLNPSFLLDAPFNGTEEEQHWMQLIAQRAGYAYSLSFQVCLFLLSFLIPLMVAFTLSRYFEDGTFRTLLSFPIGRKHYIAVKSGVLIGLSFLFPIFASVLWILIWFPASLGIQYFLIVSMSALASVFVIVSSSVLISVITKNSYATELGALLLWGGIRFLQTNIGFPLEVIQRVNQFIDPLALATFTFYGFVSDFKSIDVLVSILIAFLLSISQLVIAAFLFKRAEV